MVKITVCIECGSNKIHGFQANNLNTFHSVNGGKELGENRPYTLDGHYCEFCDEAVSVKVKEF